MLKTFENKYDFSDIMNRFKVIIKFEPTTDAYFPHCLGFSNKLYHEIWGLWEYKKTPLNFLIIQLENFQTCTQNLHPNHGQNKEQKHKDEEEGLSSNDSEII